MPGATVGVRETNDEGPALLSGALSLLWQRDMLVTLLTHVGNSKLQCAALAGLVLSG